VVFVVVEMPVVVALKLVMGMRPELARLVSELEDDGVSCEQRHHEQYSKYQEDYKVKLLSPRQVLL
jgi:hypothetical protein